MGKFLNPAIVSKPAQPPANATLPPAPHLPESVPVAGAAVVGDMSGVFASIGFFLLAVYLLSGLANDLTIRLIGSKAYLSQISGALLPIMCLLTGAIHTPLRSWIGRHWTLFAIWLILGVPFSIWRGGSLQHLISYLPKSYLLLFYIVATASTLRRCSTLFRIQVVGAAIVLFSCFAFGDYVSGRLQITDSIFFDNPNDLATHLLIYGTFVGVLLFSESVFVRVLGSALLGLSIVLILRTGSRGAFLALLVCSAVVFFLSTRKILLLILGLCFVVVTLLAVPDAALDRVRYIVFSQERPVGPEDGAYMSQQQRIELLKKAAEVTITHPIFGVGPGMFPELLYKETVETGVRLPYLNTHNSFLQVSSEGGLPALIFFTSTLGLSIRLNYRLLKQSENWPEKRQVYAMAFCLTIALVAFATMSFTHHITYTRHLPILAGLTLALSQSAAHTFQPLNGNR